MLRSILRVSVVTTTLFVLYALAPLDQHMEGRIAVELIASLIIFVVVMAWQFVAVARSPYPRLRAIEAATVGIPLFLLLFAATYFVMSSNETANFNEHLSRVDAFYFTVTVFATVGFGDIVPHTEPAKVVVTVQMLADLLVIGLIARVLIGVVQQRRQALATPPRQSDGSDSEVVPPHTNR
jgi:voltage-gated potassium channel